MACIDTIHAHDKKRIERQTGAEMKTQTVMIEAVKSVHLNSSWPRC